MSLRCESMERQAVGREVWDAFVDGCDEAWLWHRYDFQDTLCTWPRRSDASFALAGPRGELLAVVPLHRVDRRLAGLPLHRLDSLGGPAIRNSLSPRERRRVREAVKAKLTARMAACRAAELTINLPPLAPAFRGERCPRVNPLLDLGCDNTLTQTWMVDLNVSDTRLCEQMAGRARTAVRKAVQQGVRVRWEVRPGDAEQYYGLHVETYRRTGVKAHPFAYFRAIWERFVNSGLAQVGFAEVDGRVVAADTFGTYKAASLYWTGAVAREGLETAASSLLQWEALARFRAEQFEWHETGEGFPGAQSGKSKGLNDFKRSFGGELYPYYRGRLRAPGWRGRLPAILEGLR